MFSFNFEDVGEREHLNWGSCISYFAKFSLVEIERWTKNIPVQREKDCYMKIAFPKYVLYRNDSKLNCLFFRGLGGPCAPTTTTSTPAGERALPGKRAWKGALHWQKPGKGAAVPGQGPGEVQRVKTKGGWNPRFFHLLQGSWGPDCLVGDQVGQFSTIRYSHKWDSDLGAHKLLEDTSCWPDNHCWVVERMSPGLGIEPGRGISCDLSFWGIQTKT